MNRDELEKAIGWFKEHLAGVSAERVLEAARAHLATLPEPPKKVTLTVQIRTVQHRAIELAKCGSMFTADYEAAAASLAALEEFLKEWDSCSRRDVNEAEYYDTVRRFVEKFR